MLAELLDSVWHNARKFQPAVAEMVQRAVACPLSMEEKSGRFSSERQLNHTEQAQKPEVQGSSGEQHPENDGGSTHIAARAILRVPAALLHPLRLDGENGFFVSGEFLIHRQRGHLSTK